MASPRTRTAAAGSMLCQNRWLGSKLHPIAGPAIERSFSSVSGLYTTKPGCISMATFTPWSLANSACLVQYGATFFSHCQSRTSRYSGGHGQVAQLGYFALALSPGHPENSVT